MSKIKRSISLYSLQYEYLNKRMNLEDMFKFSKDLGCEGIEILPDQMLRNAPHLSDESIEDWAKLVKKYDLVSTCMDVFLNTNLYKNRILTEREGIELLREEIELAHKLDFKTVRLVSMVPAYVIEPLLPILEEYKISMDIEIHGGLGMDQPLTAEFLSKMKEADSPYVGVCLDGSIFMQRHPRVVSNYMIELGVNPDLVKVVDSFFEKGEDTYRYSKEYESGLHPELEKYCKTEIDRFYAQNSHGYEQLELSAVDDIIDYVHHFHCKLYEMTDEGVEYSIDYKRILQYLHEHNYDAFISTEYEGNRWTLPSEPTKEKEQVTAHQKMLAKYLEEIQG